MYMYIYIYIYVKSIVTNIRRRRVDCKLLLEDAVARFVGSSFNDQVSEDPALDADINGISATIGVAFD